MLDSSSNIFFMEKSLEMEKLYNVVEEKIKVVVFVATHHLYIKSYLRHKENLQIFKTG